MKLSTFVTIAAVISGSFLISNPAEARNVWIKGGCNNNGGCFYQKLISKNWPYVTYQNNTPDGMLVQVADCQQWKHKITSKDGVKGDSGWQDVMPGSIGEDNLNNVCR